MSSKKTHPNQPTLLHALGIFTYHIQCICKLGTVSDPVLKTGLHFYGGVSAQVEITSVASEEGWGREWDSFMMNGESVGNRSGAVQWYTEKCAPILEKIAKGELSAERKPC